MKLRLTSRIVLFFVLLAAVVLTAVAMLSYRNGSQTLKAAAISQMVASALEKEASVDAWMQERLNELVQLANEVDLVEKTANLLAAAHRSAETPSAHALLLEEITPSATGSGSGFTELFVIEPVNGNKKSSPVLSPRSWPLLQEHAHDQDARGKHVPAYLTQLSEHLLTEQETNARELESLRRNVEHIKEIVAMQQTYATFGGVKEIVDVLSLVEDSLRMNAAALSRHEVEIVRECETVPPINIDVSPCEWPTMRGESGSR